MRLKPNRARRPFDGESSISKLTAKFGIFVRTVGVEDTITQSPDGIPIGPSGV